MCPQVYLRNWAKDLDVPILSIDYSLAPESPFPRALEECFYAYAWAVQNCEKLGQYAETSPGCLDHHPLLGSEIMHDRLFVIYK